MTHWELSPPTLPDLTSRAHGWQEGEERWWLGNRGEVHNASAAGGARAAAADHSNPAEHVAVGASAGAVEGALFRVEVCAVP